MDSANLQFLYVLRASLAEHTFETHPCFPVVTSPDLLVPHIPSYYTTYIYSACYYETFRLFPILNTFILFK